MIKTFIPAFVLFAFLQMCSKDEPREVVSQVDQNRARWTALNIRDYEVTQQMSCYCIDEVTLPKRIVVRDGVIESIDGNPPTASDNYFKTIDDFFSYIDEKIAQNPVVANITYDPNYGFPNDIYFDVSEMIADEEIGYTLTNFVSLN